MPSALAPGTLFVSVRSLVLGLLRIFLYLDFVLCKSYAVGFGVDKKSAVARILQILDQRIEYVGVLIAKSLHHPERINLGVEHGPPSSEHPTVFAFFAILAKPVPRVHPGPRIYPGAYPAYLFFGPAVGARSLGKSHL